MAAATAVDAMETALELLREESRDHQTLQQQMTLSLDRHQTALDQMERVARAAGADPAVLRQIREAIRNPPQAPDAGGAAEDLPSCGDLNSTLSLNTFRKSPKLQT